MKLYTKNKRLRPKGLLLTILVLAFVFAGALPLIKSPMVSAQSTPQSSSGTPQDCTNPPAGETQAQCQCQNNESTPLCGGNPQGNDTCNPGSPNNPNPNYNPKSALCGDIVTNYIDPVINFIAVGVGLIIVISLVIGGIQYATSGDSPQGIEAAKNRIVNSLIALLVFALMWAFLQFIVPGGIF